MWVSSERKLTPHAGTLLDLAFRMQYVHVVEGSQTSQTQLRAIGLLRPTHMYVKRARVVHQGRGASASAACAVPRCGASGDKSCAAAR